MNTDLPIRLLIADDQALMRQGLKELLSINDDIEVISLAKDGQDALTKILGLEPDVAVVDIRMPNMSGLSLLKALSEKGCNTAILLLTTFSDDKAMIEGLCLGAKGYLLKDTSLDRLSEAIRCLAKGETYLLPAITERITLGLEKINKRFDYLEPNEKLTQREKEVLRLVGTGLKNKDIARALACTEGTIRNHMSTILSKLSVKDRTQALLKAIDQGII